MNSMLIGRLVLSLLACFFVTYFVIPYFIRNAETWGLLDKPSGRKKHLKVTPVVGGISVSIGLLIAAAIGGLFESTAMLIPLLAIMVLLVTGVVDDRRGLSPAVKWGGQAGAAVLLLLDGHYLHTFHHVLAIPELPVGVMIVLSLIFVTGLINAVNLLDGMDGLVGGISAINFVVFGVMFLLRGEYMDATLALILAAGLAAFLVYNFAPARIFMGDGGSLLLGGALAYFFMQVWNHPRNTLELYLAVALISFPVFDMVRVFVYRLRHRRSPFSADRSHFHHYLSKTGLRHAVATLIMYVLNMMLVFQAIFLSRFGLDKFIISNLLFFLLLFYLVREHSSFYEKKAG